ncbi:hypothetical protein, variant 2 [Cladophialophora immunda]|uniref:Clr5 domain-containing protein n=1 Tax=Cladophialophora immunda TaxID=569365 RepID=A0A0D1ZTY7_9EURO|nr:hypothetical protein, variant 1 [Cladophialophora immunda]XP_016251743.1 hypothetical protein, variant 2 [Cladophialophora immunda]KIW31526.1 hypothetical protein, variant 1 [Cladophialophora immunda]KIW31527.1 hypothetical protein, variant 2 [Cladophialophora immunda]OQV06614.1 hypothetical protein CLAIMM_11158 [Cladophialophora immunda]
MANCPSADQVIRIRAYRFKIVEWGLKQNQNAEDLGVIVAKREKRKREENKETIVIARGEQLATERLDLFHRRAKPKDSPSAATPQSIEYFTPIDDGRTPNALPTPAALRRAPSPASSSDAVSDNEEQKDFCKRLLVLDRTTQPAVVLRPLEPEETKTSVEHEIGSLGTTPEQTTPSLRRHLKRVRVRTTPGLNEIANTGSQVPQCPIHDLHQGGCVAIAGRGRFAKKEKPLQLLWQMKTLCHDLENALSQASISAEAGLPGAPTPTADCVSYIVRIRGNGAGMREKRQCLIHFCQRNSQIQGLLGLTKQDRMRWLQPWHETVEGDAWLILQTADHLFGGLASSYPDMHILEVLVYLHTTAPRREPILLRAAAGWDPREEHNLCLYCDDKLQTVDFMGPGGAVKLHHSASNSTNIFQPFSTFDSFRAAFAEARETVYASWSEIGRLFQGWYYAPLLRRCPCESKTHKHLGSEHYVNAFDEQAVGQEEFDPTASSYLEVPFEPCPPEHNTVLLYGSKGVATSKETWDPCGDEESEEEFDPHPEAEHDCVRDIKAVKFKVY